MDEKESHGLTDVVGPVQIDKRDAGFPFDPTTNAGVARPRLLGNLFTEQHVQLLVIQAAGYVGLHRELPQRIGDFAVGDLFPKERLTLVFGLGLTFIGTLGLRISLREVALRLLRCVLE